MLEARTLGAPQPTASQLMGYQLSSRRVGGASHGSAIMDAVAAAADSVQEGASGARQELFLSLFPTWHPRLSAGDSAESQAKPLGRSTALLLEQCRESSLAL